MGSSIKIVTKTSSGHETTEFKRKSPTFEQGVSSVHELIDQEEKFVFDQISIPQAPLEIATSELTETEEVSVVELNSKLPNLKNFLKLLERSTNKNSDVADNSVEVDKIICKLAKEVIEAYNVGTKIAWLRHMPYIISNLLNLIFIKLKLSPLAAFSLSRELYTSVKKSSDCLEILEEVFSLKNKRLKLILEHVIENLFYSVGNYDVASKFFMEIFKKYGEVDAATVEDKIGMVKQYLNVDLKTLLHGLFNENINEVLKVARLYFKNSELSKLTRKKLLEILATSNEEVRNRLAKISDHDLLNYLRDPSDANLNELLKRLGLDISFKLHLQEELSHDTTGVVNLLKIISDNNIIAEDEVKKIINKSADKISEILIAHIVPLFEAEVRAILNEDPQKLSRFEKDLLAKLKNNGITSSNIGKLYELLNIALEDKEALTGIMVNLLQGNVISALGGIVGLAPVVEKLPEVIPSLDPILAVQCPNLAPILSKVLTNAVLVDKLQSLLTPEKLAEYVAAGKEATEANKLREEVGEIIVGAVFEGLNGTTEEERRELAADKIRLSKELSRWSNEQILLLISQRQEQQEAKRKLIDKKLKNISGKVKDRLKIAQVENNDVEKRLKAASDYDLLATEKLELFLQDAAADISALLIDMDILPSLMKALNELFVKENSGELSEAEKLLLEKLKENGIMKENLEKIGEMLNQALSLGNKELLKGIVVNLLQGDVIEILDSITQLGPIVKKLPSVIPSLDPILAVQCPNLAPILSKVLTNAALVDKLLSLLTPKKLAEYVAAGKEATAASKLRGKVGKVIIEEVFKGLTGTTEEERRELAANKIRLGKELSKWTNEQILLLISQKQEQQEAKRKLIDKKLKNISGKVKDRLKIVKVEDVENDLKEASDYDLLAAEKLGLFLHDAAADISALLIDMDILPSLINALNELFVKEDSGELLAVEKILLDELKENGITKENLGKVGEIITQALSSGNKAAVKNIIVSLLKGDVISVLDNIVQLAPIVEKLPLVIPSLIPILEVQCPNLTPILSKVLTNQDLMASLQSLLNPEKSAEYVVAVKNLAAANKLRKEVGKLIIEAVFEGLEGTTEEKMRKLAADKIRLRKELSKLSDKQILLLINDKQEQQEARNKLVDQLKNISEKVKVILKTVIVDNNDVEERLKRSAVKSHLASLTLIDILFGKSVSEDFIQAKILREALVKKVVEILTDDSWSAEDKEKLRVELDKLSDAAILSIVDNAAKNREYYVSELIKACNRVGIEFTPVEIDGRLLNKKVAVAEVDKLVEEKGFLDRRSMLVIMQALSSKASYDLYKFIPLILSVCNQIVLAENLTEAEQELVEQLNSAGLTKSNCATLVKYLDEDFFEQYSKLPPEQQRQMNEALAKIFSNDMTGGICDLMNMLCKTPEGKKLLQEKIWPMAKELGMGVLVASNERELSKAENILFKILKGYGVDPVILELADHLVKTKPELVAQLTSDLLQGPSFFKWVSLVVESIANDEQAMQIIKENPSSIRILIQSIISSIPAADTLFKDYGVDLELFEAIDILLVKSPDKLKVVGELFEGLYEVFDASSENPDGIDVLFGAIEKLLKNPRLKDSTDTVISSILNNKKTQELLLKMFEKIVPMIIELRLAKAKKGIVDKFLMEFKQFSNNAQVPEEVLGLFIKFHDIEIFAQWAESNGIKISSTTKKRFKNEIAAIDYNYNIRETSRRILNLLPGILKTLPNYPQFVTIARSLLSSHVSNEEKVLKGMKLVSLIYRAGLVSQAIGGTIVYRSMASDVFVEYDAKKLELADLKKRINTEGISREQRVDLEKKIQDKEEKLLVIKNKLLQQEEGIISEIAMEVARLVFQKMFGSGISRGKEQRIINEIVTNSLRQIDILTLRDMFTSVDGSYDIHHLNSVYVPLIEQFCAAFLSFSERTQTSQGWAAWGVTALFGTSNTSGIEFGDTENRSIIIDLVSNLLMIYSKLDDKYKELLKVLHTDLSSGLKLKHYWLVFAIINDFNNKCLPYMDKIANLDAEERKKFISTIIDVYTKEVRVIDQPKQLQEVLNSGSISTKLNGVFGELDNKQDTALSTCVSCMQLQAV